jgi:hypothetical protein
VAEHLPSKYEARRLNPSTRKKEREREKEGRKEGRKEG